MAQEEKYDWDKYEVELVEKQKLEARIRVTEVDFDLVIRNGITSGQEIIKSNKSMMYQLMQEYVNKEKLKKAGIRLNYYRTSEGIIIAEPDDTFDTIKQQRWTQ